MPTDRPSQNRRPLRERSAVVVARGRRGRRGLIALGVLVICDMVVERYLLNRTTIWQIDVVTYCIVAAAFIGSPYVLHTHGHVNVDVLPLYLGPRAR